MFGRPRFTLTLSALLLGSALLAGCDSEVVLSGNFAEWPSGFNNGSLPGDPTGDTVFQFVDGNFAMAQVWSDKLYLMDAACPAGGSCASPARFVDFKSMALDTSQQTSPFTWVIGGKSYLQPGCDLSIDLYHGHFDAVATLRFQREPGQDGTVTLVHGGGSQLLETLGSAEDFGYVVHADPATSTFDVLGVAGATGLPSITNPTSTKRGFAMSYGGPGATSSALIIDVLKAHAED